jgi:hypothetical protein
MSMTPEEAIKILEAKSKCMKREVSGTDLDCNFRNCDECDLCYKQGTTGDQMEALRVAISALQAQDVPDTNVGDMISRQAAIALADNLKDNLPDDERVADAVMVHNEGILEYQTALSMLPSTQTEIIRCKDCKWWSNDDYRECSNPNYDDGYITPAGFYCGYAERKGDE